MTTVMPLARYSAIWGRARERHHYRRTTPSQGARPAAVLNARRHASNIVLLTGLGGGAFGNDESWIEAAIRRALEMTSGFDLDVRLVSYGAPSRSLEQLAKKFGEK